MIARKPAALTRIKDPYRTIEAACFLRLMLLRLMGVIAESSPNRTLRGFDGAVHTPRRA
jgi:hypothetical protein